MINSWTVDLPATTKPPYTPPAPPAAGASTKKVLHISDVHMDLSYLVCRQFIEN